MEQQVDAEPDAQVVNRDYCDLTMQHGLKLWKVNLLVESTTQ